MDEKDQRIQQLTQDAARWRNRAIEAAQRACDECEEYVQRREGVCRKCRMREILEEAGK